MGRRKKFPRKEIDELAAADGYVFFQACDGMSDRALYEHSETGMRRTYLHTGRVFLEYMPRGGSGAFHRQEEVPSNTNSWVDDSDRGRIRGGESTR